LIGEEKKNRGRIQITGLESRASGIGFGSSCRFLPAFHPNRFRIFFLKNPGLGNSENPRQFTFEVVHSPRLCNTGFPMPRGPNLRTSKISTVSTHFFRNLQLRKPFLSARVKTMLSAHFAAFPRLLFKARRTLVARFNRKQTPSSPPAPLCNPLHKSNFFCRAFWRFRAKTCRSKLLSAVGRGKTLGFPITKKNHSTIPGGEIGRQP